MRIFAVSTILLIGILYGIILFKVMIPLLRRFKLGQAIRSEGPKAHLNKKGTPTMGGLVIIIMTTFLFITLGLLNYQKSNNSFLESFFLLFPFLSFGLIGFIDDYLIIKKKLNDGLKPSIKFILQLFISAICYYILMTIKNHNEINFFGHFVDLRFFYGIFIVICYAGFSNATNLTDGLDGLLGGTSLIIITGICVIAYYEQKMMTFYFGLSLIISLLTFLVFNLPKAQIFMGDVGSLSIGAAILTMLLSLEKEVLIFIFGFIYVLETLSVMLQVWFFKKTNGQRLFKMTPLHHHFEMLGLNEQTIDVIFWLISFVFTILGCYLGVKIFE